MLSIILSLSCFMISSYLGTVAISPTRSYSDLQESVLTKAYRRLTTSNDLGPIKTDQNRISWVLANSVASDDCQNNNGKQLFESIATLSNACIIYRNTAQRWSCNATTVHVEEFAIAACEETHRTVNTYMEVDKCHSSKETDDNLGEINWGNRSYSILYSCSSTNFPKGSWYTSMYYSDKECKKELQSVSILNGYCFTPDAQSSFQYDFPNQHFYSKKNDCTGSSTAVNLTSTSNHCLSLTPTIGSASSLQYLHVVN